MTTFEPGASDGLTHGFVSRPRSTAFFARRPAATRTDGFEVFVQEVIAEMTTAPCGISYVTRPSTTGTVASADRALAEHRRELLAEDLPARP